MKYKYLLFDLDGTLIDTNQLILDSFKHTYKAHFDAEISDEEIFKYFGEPLLVTLSRFSKEKSQELFKTYIEYNERHHDSCVNICKDIKEGLEKLQKLGCTLAVVTSKRAKLAHRGLELFDIKKYFKVIVTLDDTDKHKPEPHPVLKALELLEAKPEEALMIGDSIFDIQCAHNAGVKAALVNWSAAHGHQEKGINADYVIEEVHELIEVINE